jgi:hydroxyethylthiazole kinase-like uncharacterized protein yjeF
MVEVGEWSRADTARLLRVPTSTDDKYSRGVVALRTGSSAYPGAAVLGVEAAWRAGAGYVRFVGEGRAADAVIARRPETVAASEIGGTRVDAWVIGSGTDAAARSADETRALQEILTGTVPVVVDAGALDLIGGASAPLIATPHAGEFARLRESLGLDASQNDDRAAAVAEVARALSITVLLKGATTFISSPKGVVTAVQSGPGWLAAAGTGDVLAGVIGAVTAANPGAPLADTAAAGAWLHGYAGVVASGMRDGRPGHPIVALDVAEAVPQAIGDLLS